VDTNKIDREAEQAREEVGKGLEKIGRRLQGVERDRQEPAQPPQE
jgi:hypothetical protein